MAALVFCVLIVTVMAVFFGLWLGIRTLSLAVGHPDSSSLKLMACNLLEPCVTLFVLFLVSSLLQGSYGTGYDPFPVVLLSSVPLSLMLLAPLVVRTGHPIRVTLIVYGLLRWANTVAIWIFSLMLSTLRLQKGFGNDVLLRGKIHQIELITPILILVGTVLLCVNFLHLLEALDAFKTRSVSGTTADSPRA